MGGGVKEVDFFFLGWERLRHNHGQMGMIQQRGWEGGGREAKSWRSQSTLSTSGAKGGAVLLGRRTERKA